ncbi:MULTISPECIES: hypothetical protein [unclassified Sulfuricurvum]|uniref:hypothetical protein n=1 Tax=unclassified Sulfuricurvum TaxID=2632390 RepID=UPI0002999E4D|nr:MULTISPECIES: hypothetical protein [unclassified Sulfuricurvum]OHD84079.1 MAG: hypothetical protein A3J39_02060 [Sulfuricurvum sp. RIFCSPHIGHO2_12_FULL_44_8]OHD86463.1 MAG: hypothetical protein A3I60_01980 [Sulfuricurvum sp. RIFCSPLOWO2_02_FULL_43_45]OHD87027.1 MAG: hypothetical protein A2Y52_09175 [Sulfuricurvum sp. RIFCSPLOWO2_02_43_6]OHD87497.1 MAG: hypothetical protein A2W83_00440 [Sulfuricurvum sp. RIFCSPLOWO2_12_43_5]AFV96411.1 hypothetical protein B649_00485 [Candidatus Sulfuricurvum
MKKALFLATVTVTLLVSGCAEKQIAVNGVICPAGKTEERIKADFQECRYYDLKAATEASRAPITVECQKCLENKGYRIEQ